MIGKILLAAFYAFDYGGKPAIGPDAAPIVRTISDDAVARRTIREWKSPDGRLLLRSTETEYRCFPVTEYVPELVCLGDRPTEIVDGFRSLAVRYPGVRAVLRALHGTMCTPRDFAPETIRLGTGAGATNRFEMVATEGRSSAQWMPWWGIDLPTGDGFEFALGWTGAWRADFSVDGSGVTMSAGLVKTHFRLLPGETLRQPSLLVFRRDRSVSPRGFQTVIHRFMLDVKSPRDANGELIHGISALTTGGGNKTPEMMKKVIDWKVVNDMPFDCFWVDAGWNGPAHQPDLISNCGDMWYNFTGDWRFNPTVHPDGDLGSVADAAHAAGMRMLLWMEPERCVADPPPPVFREHRDWLLPKNDADIRNKRQLVVDFGNPDALDWVIETVSEHVRRCKLDVFRQDFNMNALPIWQGNDAEDRQGVTETKHVMGLWKFWDTLRARFPHLVIESCASGGRRLDFEAVSRGHSYCRTDYAIFHRDPTQITDVQNVSLSTLAYLPFQGSESTPAAFFDDYGLFSSFASGNVFTPSDWNAGIVRNDFTPEQIEWLREGFATGRRMMPYYEGDYYPLTDNRETVALEESWKVANADETRWCAWQMHRSDRNDGFAIFFRRLNTPSRLFVADLGGIDEKAQYEVETWHGPTERMSGSKLRHLTVDLQSPRSFRLIFYRKTASCFETPQVRARTGNASIKCFGSTWVCGSAPEIADDVSFQVGNDNPRVKLPVRESGEIGFNYLGADTRLIHDECRDEMPEEPVHLIDGDPSTCWMSRGLSRPDAQSVWVRIDLVRESMIRNIRLVKRAKDASSRKPADRHPTPNAVEVGRGLPGEMEVLVSRDAATWETVFSGPTGDTDEKEFLEVVFSPRPGKQIWLKTSKLRLVEFFGYAFSAGEIEVFDERGANMASIARGAGVTVSSTYHGEGLTRTEQRGLWPILWDSGIKWARIGYHDDPVNWHWVEREKGKLRIDSMTDEAITALAKRGIRIVFALGFGNRLYCGPFGPRSFPQLAEFNWDIPEPPTTSEALAAWDRYVEFVVRHFADRVDTFEVWNEWNITPYFGREPLFEDYERIAARTIPIIRRLAPNAKVSLGAVSGFPGRELSTCSAEERAKRLTSKELRAFRRFAKEVDAIGFHPFYNPKPGKLARFDEDLVELVKIVRGWGFKGVFMPSEWNVNSMYPAFDSKDAKDVWCGTYSPSELQRAKEVAQHYVRFAGFGMPSMFCEMGGTSYVQTNLSFFRAGFHSDPITPIQPDASYYALRNLATIMDGLKAEEAGADGQRQAASAIRVRPTSRPSDDTRNFKTACFRNGDVFCVACWYEDDRRDDSRRLVSVDLTLPPGVFSAVARDPLNGVEQVLNVSASGGNSVVKGLLVGDAPVFVVTKNGEREVAK